MVAMNHGKKPFDDKRVRRALTLALDRYEGSKALSKIAIVKEVAGIQVPGTPWATPPDELAKLAGYGRDINASRAEAKRLLKEAGAEGLSFTFKNRGIPQPYEPTGIWLIDQWRQIGLTVKQEIIEAVDLLFHAQARRLRGRHGLPVRLHRRARPRPAPLPVRLRRQLRQVATTRSSTTSTSSRRAPPTPRSARSTCARSRSGCSTRRCIRS